MLGSVVNPNSAVLVKGLGVFQTVFKFLLHFPTAVKQETTTSLYP